MTKRLRWNRFLGLSIAGLFAAAVAHSSETAGSSAKTPPAVDPVAMGILKGMCDTLASAKAITFRSNVIIEAPARTGQHATLFPEFSLALKRPNLLKARMRGEAPHFDFFYNGKTVSAFAPERNTFSVVDAPPTIDAMLPDLETETGIRFPMTPLLVSNPYAALSKGVTRAVVIGQSTVNGKLSDHLAFRAPGVNWEVWVSRGARPLPQRLAATFVGRPGSPRVIAEFSSWNLNPWLFDSCFTFRPPSNATQIPFQPILSTANRR